jgi:hypothetical protein
VWRAGDLDPVPGPQVEREGVAWCAGPGVDHGGGAPAGVHDDRCPAREDQHAGTGTGADRPAVPLAVPGPDQLPGVPVEHPDPVVLVERDDVRADLTHQWYRWPAPDHRARVGGGQYAAPHVEREEGVRPGEGAQPVARVGQRGRRRGDLERGPVDATDRAGAPVHRVPGRALLHRLDPVAGRRHADPGGHFSGGAVDQGELTRVRGGQPGLSGQQPGPVLGVPAVRSEYAPGGHDADDGDAGCDAAGATDPPPPSPSGHAYPRKPDVYP